MDVEPDAPGALGDDGTLLQRVVDAVDAVALHRQQEAAGNGEWILRRCACCCEISFIRQQNIGKQNKHNCEFEDVVRRQSAATLPAR